jgi:ribonuclease J
MTKLTFYGGVEEIGGNKILLEDRDTRVLLDFGMSFADRRKFYSDPWLSPKDEKELLEFGILPALRGVYRFEDVETAVDAVILTHSHADHAAYIAFIKRDIPVYCGETTRRILEGLSETRHRSFETDISGVNFQTFRTGSKLRLRDIEVEPYHVDHSTPGAYGYIIHTSQGAIVYTGDFRTHGSRPDLTSDFVEASAKARPALMISEGTNMMDADVSSEHEVRSKASKVVAGTEKLVLTDFSFTDIDRFKTFYEVAESNNRALAISLKQANLLCKLRSDGELKLPDVTSDRHIVIYRRGKKRYYDWEEKLLDLGNVMEASEIRRHQDHLLLVCSFSDVRELVEIKPEPGSNFILSGSEPFNEEKEIEFDKFRNWLDHFGLPMYHIHSSGHIMPNELKRVVSSICPKTVLPVHTEHPALFARFMEKTTRIQLPRRFETCCLSRQ